ncbi:MAG: MFS transporter [Candidatus Dormibacteria bacterium]
MAAPAGGPRAGGASTRATLSVTLAWLSLLAGANLPTPLYLLYERRFHLSSVGVTLIFATYALVLMPSLLFFGQLSDRIGRRSTIAAGLGSAMVGLLLFALADSTAWLFVARGFQGLAVGMISGSATAALVELDPDHDPRRAALPAGLAQAGGGSGGALLAGLLGQFAPAPMTLCYLVMLALTAAAAVTVLVQPQGPRHHARAWRVQRPSVPGPIRVPFARVGITGAAVWAVAALFFAVVPTYASELLRSRNLALLGSIAATMLATSCIAQLTVRRARSTNTAQVGGLTLLVAGLALLVAAFPLRSLPILVLAALFGGAGHGWAFVAAQTALNDIAPDDRRGEVSAAFYVCIYLGVAVPVISVGMVAAVSSLFTAVAIFAGVVGSAALANAVGLARKRL